MLSYSLTQPDAEPMVKNKVATSIYPRCKAFAQKILRHTQILQSLPHCEINYEWPDRSLSLEHPDAKNIKVFFTEVTTALNNGIGELHINFSLVGGPYKVAPTDKIATGHIRSISLTRNISGELHLRNLRISEMVIHSSRVHPLLVSIENCHICKLTIRESSGPPLPSLTMKDSTIKDLVLSSNALQRWSVNGGAILNFQCPSPDQQNPFTGSVALTKVFIPRTTKRYPLDGSQPYRNMRAHLLKLENVPTANLFHSAELAIEREESDSLVYRIISRLYEYASEFGVSVSLPILWMLLLFIASTWAVLSFGGVEAKNEGSLMGWQLIFSPSEPWFEVIGAAYVASKAVITPFGLFGHNPLLVPNNPWVAAWLTIDSVISLVLLALLISAIRRRFKIQRPS